MPYSPVKLGDKITFKPACFDDLTQAARFRFYTEEARAKYVTEVTGRVCMIHHSHGWYRVRYFVNGRVNYECFRIPVPEAPQIKPNQKFLPKVHYDG